MFRAYLLSYLARQYAILKASFDARHRQAWLVWEPGTWNAPPANAAVSETRLPSQRARPSPIGDDALCFELLTKPDAAKAYRIGRADDSELVLSDATVSREHCTLRCEGGRWYVKASPTVKSMTVDGKNLGAGNEVQLRSGHSLQLGEVRLTFMDPNPFIERVASAAGRL